MDYREKRNQSIEADKEKRRKEVEDLINKYRPAFEQIFTTISDHIDSLFDGSEEDCECHCPECEGCNEYIYDDYSYDEEDWLVTDVVRPLIEVLNRWSEDPHYSSDDAMDAIANIVESNNLEEL